MKTKITFLLIGVILASSLAACTALRIQSSDPAATETLQASMPNSASVFCEENGNTLEIRTAADGSQSGFCIFPDCSECDEWAYFRGECGTETMENPKLKQATEPTSNANGGYIQPGISEPIEDWWGVIKSTQPGAQYDDYFERQDLGESISFGVDSLIPMVEAQIQALCDSGKVVHLYGSLVSNVPDYNGSLILVDRIRIEE